MSKSLGNIIDPWSILDTRGADAMRWWMFSQGSPWTPTRATLGAIDTAMRDMLLTLWNTFSFFTTYASLNGFEPTDAAIPPAADRGPLDRWILSRLASATAEATEALSSYEPLPAATALGDLVDDLSNWFVRRSRRRFWRTDPDAPPGDTLSAQATLHEVLTTLALVLAPFCPFVADAMWRQLTGAAEDESVHLADWPVADTSLIDRRLEEQMALARRLTSLGRAARSEASVKVRQPLKRALVFLPVDAPEILEDIVKDELNVDEIDTADDLSDVLQFKLVPNFKTLGSRLRDLVKELAPALAALDSVAVAAELEAGRSITVVLGGQPVELSPEDLELRVQGQQGFAVSREGGEVVALDLDLDLGLRQRGLSRDVVRFVQDLRKASGLEVSDRIRLFVVGLEPIAELFDYIAREVLAVEILTGPGPGEGTVLELDDDILTEPVRVWIERVDPAA
jgi:isoleucyl-tRNA synthetase